jgi:hypothetical protein
MAQTQTIWDDLASCPRTPLEAPTSDSSPPESIAGPQRPSESFSMAATGKKEMANASAESANVSSDANTQKRKIQQVLIPEDLRRRALKIVRECSDMLTAISNGFANTTDVCMRALHVGSHGGVSDPELIAAIGSATRKRHEHFRAFE